MSFVWKYFTVLQDDASKARCVICGAVRSRGGKKSNGFTTSNLMKHLEREHKSKLFLPCPNEMPVTQVDCTKGTASFFPTKHNISLGENPTSTASEPGSLCSQDTVTCNATFPTSSCKPTRQLSLAATWDKNKKYSKNHPRAQELTDGICKMLVLDCQPFSFVENEGFRSLMSKAEPKFVLPTRRELSHKLIPEMYAKTVTKVKEQLANVAHMSVTCDFWSSHSNEDFLALTCHLLQGDRRQSLCLEAIPFTQDHHTAENIKVFLEEVMNSWNILDKVDVVVRDNAANITSGVEKLGLCGIPCTAHTVQLIVKNGCFNMPSVTTLVAKCRRLVGSFRHSLNATKALGRAQELLGMKKKRLLQDEPTRWDSTYTMLERLLEQKSVVSLCCSELNLNSLTSSEWKLIESVLQILKFFTETTKTVSRENCTISEVVPVINSLRKAVENDTTMGLQNMKNDIIHNIEVYFPSEKTESNKCYALATILDPRFKNKIFSQPRFADMAVNMLLEEAKAFLDTITQCSETSTPLSPTKKLKPTSLKEFRALLLENSCGTSSSVRQNPAELEVQKYLDEPLISDEGNIFHYWETTSHSVLKKLAAKYLCVPATSVPSERLFSTCGNFYGTKRHSLKPEKLRMLVFLNKNLGIV